MKKKLYSFHSPLLIIALLFLSSCNKWLDVSPATQVKESTQFSNRQGAVDALFSIYQDAAATDAYGGYLTYSYLDVLAQRYENKSTSSSYYYQAARYNYTTITSGLLNGKTATEGIWSALYGIIAQSNYVLKNIENSRSVVSTQEYNIIKGEALAMRAFCHFDLARLFSGTYATAQNSAAIPYMKEFTVIPRERLTLSEVIDECEGELKQAEELLSAYTDIDQIAQNQGSTNSDLLLMYRQNHLNYWAVKATLARLYLYKGDKINALKSALEVINSGKFKFVDINTLNTDHTSASSDLTFSSEHIFSIYVSNLGNIADDLFKNTSAGGAESTDLFSTLAKLNSMYEVSVAGYGTDIRNPSASRSLWNQVSSAIVYSKKFYSNSSTNVKQRIIPVLKLPEMYYIAAESAPTLNEATNYLNTVRASRLLPALGVLASNDALNAELQKEYRKEFYGEGQLWFYYKRMNVLTIPDGVSNPMSDAKYIFPRPDAEIEFGK